MKRQKGWYWLKKDNEWFPGQYAFVENEHRWIIPNCDHEILEDWFDEIDEKQIKRE